VASAVLRLMLTLLLDDRLASIARNVARVIDALFR
jgi:hypothetical protein